MRKFVLRIGALLITFTISIAIVSLLRTRKAHVALTSTEDVWHQIYEAAGMSGDQDLQSEVQKAMYCLNKGGRIDAKLIEDSQRLFCQTADGNLHELRFGQKDEYGSYYMRIKDSHVSWALKNLDVVKKFSDKKVAESFVKHRRPLYRWE